MTGKKMNTKPRRKCLLITRHHYYEKSVVVLKDIIMLKSVKRV